jgi:hypothetical protein
VSPLGQVYLSVLRGAWDSFVFWLRDILT